MKKEIIVKEVFKLTSEDEKNKYLREKIVKLMMQNLESKTPVSLCADE